MSKIADDILDILGECRTEGNILYLPDQQLDRPTYQAVNKVLESIGGKWNRKAKGHVFADGNPAELLDSVILAGEITDLKKQYQFFPTPRPIAEKMCELAELDDTCIVLEPSCGKGNLADVVFEAGVKELVGLELNREMEKHLSGKPYATLTGIDFLEFVKDPGIKTPWTRIVMNPPFSRQQDIDHILTAYGILRPGGILVSVVSESPFFRSNKKSVDFRAFLEEHGATIVPVEEGAFKESGTMVRTRLVKIIKPPTSEILMDETESTAEAQTNTEVVPDGEALSKIGQLMTQLPVDQLHPHPDNPRKELGDLTELADSIKANGILQNLTVVPDNNGYTVIIGHRRLAAAKLAGLKEVPCVITEMDQKEQVQTMLLENMARSDLTPYEEAQGFQMMLDLGSTVEEIAEKSGFSKTTVRRRVKLLELDADKFKKSEARGATLQDYLELDKIESPELKNKALDAIGTANFRDVLKKTIEDEKHLRRMAQWETDLEAFALKIEKRDYVGDASVPMDYVRNFGRWSPKDTIVERPADVGEVKYYYRVSADQIDLYRDRQEHVETEEDRQRKEQKRIADQIKAELQEITRRHFTLRSEFISSFGASKKNALQIMKYAVGIIIGDGEYGRDDINVDLLAKLLNLDIEDNTTYPELKAMVDACSEKRQEYILLVCAYASCDEDDNGYWHWQWSDGAYHYVYKPNDDLDHLYDFLVSIGYEMSDEEKALRDGTHELFHREETEKKETAPAEDETDQDGKEGQS